MCVSVCVYYKVSQQQQYLLSFELLMWKKVAATAEDFNKFVINMSQISLVDSQTEYSTAGHIIDG